MIKLKTQEKKLKYLYSPHHLFSHSHKHNKHSLDHLFVHCEGIILKVCKAPG